MVIDMIKMFARILGQLFHFFHNLIILVLFRSPQGKAEASIYRVAGCAIPRNFPFTAVSRDKVSEKNRDYISYLAHIYRYSVFSE